MYSKTYDKFIEVKKHMVICLPIDLSLEKSEYPAFYFVNE